MEFLQPDIILFFFESLNPRVPLTQIVYGTYGNSIIIYSKPYSGFRVLGHNK